MSFLNETVTKPKYGGLEIFVTENDTEKSILLINWFGTVRQWLTVTCLNMIVHGKSNLILDLNMEEGKKKRKERREIGKGMKIQKEEKRE